MGIWANILKWLAIEIIIPLVKDGIFMVVNLIKVRQLRKEKEAEAAKKAAEYEQNPTSDNFGKLP